MQSDAQIIQYVVAGDRAAFSQLIVRHQDAVFRLARGLLRDASEAEDAAQEAFLKAFVALPRYDSRRAAFKTWLLIITRRVCLNILDKHSPRPDAGHVHPAALDPPDTDLVQAEYFAVLDAALRHLPIEQRACWTLVQIVGLTYREVAGIEGIDVGTVKSRLHRAGPNCLPRSRPDYRPPRRIDHD